MKITNVNSQQNSSFGMKFTPETKQLATKASDNAIEELLRSEKLKSSSNYLVHIIPPETKTILQKFFGAKDKDQKDYWRLCVSNPTEFPELGATFYEFLGFTKNNKIADVAQVFISDFFVKEKAYNALAQASKTVKGIEHPPYPKRKSARSGIIPLD